MKSQFFIYKNNWYRNYLPKMPKKKGRKKKPKFEIDEDLEEYPLEQLQMDREINMTQQE